MAKILDARVRQKKDTLENWMANPLVLLSGEQAFVVEEDGTGNSFKIGDGIRTFADLPWFYITITGEKVVVVDTVAELKALPAMIQNRLVTGLLSGVQVNGYYAKDDTPASIMYYYSTTEDEEDGGSIFELSNIKVKHDFVGEVDVRYYGVKADVSFSSNDDFLNNVFLKNRNVTGGGKLYNIYNELDIPHGTYFSNFYIKLNTPGQNGIRFNSNCRITNFTIEGTNTKSITERLMYTAVDGVNGCYIQGKLKKGTVGVQASPVSGLSGDAPHSNEYVLEFEDIIGTPGMSEGYGLLCSPSHNNKIQIIAKNVERHVLYISAGGSRNVANVIVDGCGHTPVNLQSYDSQPACEQNNISVIASNIKKSVGATGDSSACVLSQNVSNNNIKIDVVSSGETEFASVVQGVGTTAGPHPKNNTIQVNARGVFTGYAVCLSIDSDNTNYVNPNIVGKSSNSLIRITNTPSNLYTPKIQAKITGGLLDGIDGLVANGLSITSNVGTVQYSDVDIRNVVNKISDSNSRKMGYGRIFSSTIDLLSVSAAGNKSAVVTFPGSITNPIAVATITSSGSLSSKITCQVRGINENQCTVFVFNDGDSEQALIRVNLIVTGN